MYTNTLQSILLVDDDETSCFVSRVFINRILPGLQVDTVYNGGEALLYLEEHIDDPDFPHCLLVLDIEMPIMNGWDFLTEYEKRFSKEQKSRVDIVVLSMYREEVMKAQIMGYPAVRSCYQKPLTDVKLRKMVRRFYPEVLQKEKKSVKSVKSNVA